MSIDGVSAENRHASLVYRGPMLTPYQSIRYTLQGYATSSFAAHSLLTTMGVLQGVIGAAGQPIAAKLSDVFGRVELLIVGLVFYCVGTIVECTSNSVSHYSGGVVLYQIGYTIYTIIIQVIVTDLSSLQARLFVSFIPPSPYLINSWIAAEITPHFTKDGGLNLWRWGLGMLAIITPCKLYIQRVHTPLRSWLTFTQSPPFSSLSFSSLLAEGPHVSGLWPVTRPPSKSSEPSSS